MKTDEIRSKFIEFYETKGHVHVPCDSLVPSHDKSLLFTGAGMNQFKDVFYGHRDLGVKRAVNCQKCFRTNDIENVGRTASHHTLFEMLGSFSFGDYFKEDSIKWAWEFLLEWMNIPEERWFVSVFQDDDEAYDIWHKQVGLAPERIFRFGESDNFWPANARTEGPDGPCGPCSEIFYDRGEGTGCGKPECNPSCSCGRFVEIHNLVFQQFDRQPGGRLIPLAQKNIDTGLGLERLARVMQDVPTDYEIDIFVPLVAQACETISPDDPDRLRELAPIRRIADHARAVAFCVADGVRPSNEGRGYVVRRLIRRAVRDAAQLGLDRPFLHETVPTVVGLFGHFYPELVQHQGQVEKVILTEEDAFLKTVARGTDLLEGYVRRLKDAGEKVLPGPEAFDLYATYGFPVEMTEALLEEHGLSVDMDAYREEEDTHRAQSQAATRFKGPVFDKGPFAEIKATVRPTQFVGYETLTAEATVVAILDKAAEQLLDAVEEGQEAYVLLDVTPAYGEAGGQVGDTGTIASADGEFAFTATERREGYFLHLGSATTGRLGKGDRVKVQVDEAPRAATMRNHTATHLLHNALKRVLGDHVNQAGSHVAPDRLRFDFTHNAAMSADEIRRVEDIVNERILADLPVSASLSSIDEARAKGAIALFGEKYGETVRVVHVEDTSRELCGGTHCRSTGQIGAFCLVSEGSVGGGLRRIEAVTGTGTIQRLRSRDAMISELSGLLGAPEDVLPKRCEDLVKQVKTLQKELSSARSLKSKVSTTEMLDSAERVGDSRIVHARLDDAGAGELRSAADSLRKEGGSVALILGSARGGKVLLIAALTPDLVKRGLHAGELLKEIAPIVKGGGGGKPDMAQAGGADGSALDKALETGAARLKEALS